MDFQQQLLAIVRCALNGTAFSQELSSQDYQQLWKLANQHGIGATIACCAPNTALLQHNAHLCMAKNDNQLFALQEIQSALERAGIDHIAVKGANTKLRYPSSELRPMGDLDFLYRPEQQKQLQAVMQSLGFTDFKEGRRHDYYNRPPFVSVEMHRLLFGSTSDFYEYYLNFFSRCHLRQGCKHTYEMSLEDEMLLNFIHMTDDFKQGRVAVRYVMDAYVYSHLQNVNFDFVWQELNQLGIDKFCRNICQLAEFWFGTGDSSDLLLKLSAFILDNGIEGKFDREASLEACRNGKRSLLWSALFPDYRQMCSLYAWLSRCPVLLPFAWILRIFRGLFHRKGHVKEQLRLLQSANSDFGRELLAFQHECGL